MQELKESANSVTKRVTDTVTRYWIFLIALIVYLMEVALFSVTSVVPITFKRKKNVKGEIVLITGGASGFGRLMAVKFAQLGCKVVIWDVDEKGSAETCRIVSNKKGCEGQIYRYKVDITDKENVYRTAKKVKVDVGFVSILINNAGVGTGSYLQDTDDVKIEKVIQVNTLSHFWTCKAFMGDMLKANHGHIVCVSSFAGFAGLPKGCSYTASKHAVMGLMEALTYEIQVQGKTGVKTTVACPNFSSTGFFEGALNGTMEMSTPEDVVEDIVNGVLTNQEFVFTPRYLFWAAVGKQFGNRKANLRLGLTLFGTQGADQIKMKDIKYLLKEK